MTSTPRIPGPGEEGHETAVPRGVMEGRLDAGLRPARGVLVVPFLLGTGIGFVALIGLGRPVEGHWAITALAVGLVAAVVSLALALGPRSRHRKKAMDPKASDENDGPVDPLSNVKTVESQARRHGKPCPNCGTAVTSRQERCANCDHLLLVECKGCRTKVRLDWSACPECGRGLP